MADVSLIARLLADVSLDIIFSSDGSGRLSSLDDKGNLVDAVMAMLETEEAPPFPAPDIDVDARHIDVSVLVDAEATDFDYGRFQVLTRGDTGISSEECFAFNDPSDEVDRDYCEGATLEVLVKRGLMVEVEFGDVDVTGEILSPSTVVAGGSRDLRAGAMLGKDVTGEILSPSTVVAGESRDLRVGAMLRENEEIEIEVRIEGSAVFPGSYQAGNAAVKAAFLAEEPLAASTVIRVVLDGMSSETVIPILGIEPGEVASLRVVASSTLVEVIDADWPAVGDADG